MRREILSKRWKEKREMRREIRRELCLGSEKAQLKNDVPGNICLIHEAFILSTT